MLSLKEQGIRKERTKDSALSVVLSRLLHVPMLSTYRTYRYITKGNPLQANRHGSQEMGKEHTDTGRRKGEERGEERG